jgi:hypothetical protein
MVEMIDPKIERKAIYKSFKGNPGPCPQCGGVLKKSYQSYLVATRTASKMDDSFMIGGDFGWFCASCPTAVLDRNELGKMLHISLPGWKVGQEFAVLGLVDLDRMQANRRNLPPGAPGNPIPLVRFTYPGKSENQQPVNRSKKHRKR